MQLIVQIYFAKNGNWPCSRTQISSFAYHGWSLRQVRYIFLSRQDNIMCRAFPDYGVKKLTGDALQMLGTGPNSFRVPEHKIRALRTMVEA